MKKSPDWIHDLLDGKRPEIQGGGSGIGELERLKHYRRAVELLQNHFGPAPEDLVDRVMDALPTQSRFSLKDRFQAWWEVKWRWFAPTLAGALCTLLLVAALTHFGRDKAEALVPVPFEIYAPFAKQVELVGSFSEWTPGRIVLHGPDSVGYFGGVLRLPAGQYEYLFLVDGKTFISDCTSRSCTPDGFGRMNHVLFVRPGMASGSQIRDMATRDWDLLADHPEKDGAGSLQGTSEDQFKTIATKAEQNGIDPLSLKGVVFRLFHARLSLEKVKEVLGPVLLAGQLGISHEMVIIKIHEGVLKGASPEKLITVTQNRVDSIKKAMDLLMSAGLEKDLSGPMDLPHFLATALERGRLPQETLKEVARMAGLRSPWQVMTVIEAGESLCRAGVGPETLTRCIGEWFKKDISPEEILRATRLMKQRLDQGAEG